MKLEIPLFYQNPIGIRFAIGPENIGPLKGEGREDLNEDYFNEALRRACLLFEASFAGPDVLSCVTHEPLCHPIKITVTRSQFDHTSVLRRIIYSDFGSGHSADEFFVSEQNDLAYHLYDDRGLDVVADSVTLLRPLYVKFNNWILDYDRDRIDRVFRENHKA